MDKYTERYLEEEHNRVLEEQKKENDRILEKYKEENDRILESLKPKKTQEEIDREERLARQKYGFDKTEKDYEYDRLKYNIEDSKYLVTSAKAKMEMIKEIIPGLLKCLFFTFISFVVLGLIAVIVDAATKHNADWFVWIVFIGMGLTFIITGLIYYNEDFTFPDYIYKEAFKIKRTKVYKEIIKFLNSMNVKDIWLVEIDFEKVDILDGENKTIKTFKYKDYGYDYLGSLKQLYLIRLIERKLLKKGHRFRFNNTLWKCDETSSFTPSYGLKYHSVDYYLSSNPKKTLKEKIIEKKDDIKHNIEFKKRIKEIEKSGKKDNGLKKW